MRTTFRLVFSAGVDGVILQPSGRQLRSSWSLREACKWRPSVMRSDDGLRFGGLFSVFLVLRESLLEQALGKQYCTPL